MKLLSNVASSFGSKISMLFSSLAVRMCSKTSPAKQQTSASWSQTSWVTRRTCAFPAFLFVTSNINRILCMKMCCFVAVIFSTSCHIPSAPPGRPSKSQRPLSKVLWEKADRAMADSWEDWGVGDWVCLWRVELFTIFLLKTNPEDFGGLNIFTNPHRCSQTCSHAGASGSNSKLLAPHPPATVSMIWHKVPTPMGKYTKKIPYGLELWWYWTMIRAFDVTYMTPPWSHTSCFPGLVRFEVCCHEAPDHMNWIHRCWPGMQFCSPGSHLPGGRLLMKIGMTSPLWKDSFYKVGTPISSSTIRQSFAHNIENKIGWVIAPKSCMSFAVLAWKTMASCNTDFLCFSAWTWLTWIRRHT